MDDPRFKHVASDPRFKAIPKKYRKVAIDSRFQSMFTGNRFKVKYKVDKRGRKVKQSSSEDLRRFYELQDNSKHESSDRGKEKKKKHAIDEKISGLIESTSDSESSSDAESAEISNAEEEDESESESSSDESLTDGDQENQPDVMDVWHERTEGVPLTNDTAYRLAVCDMDWDRVDAKDIFVLLNSFKPAGSSVLSVTVYPSDFGLERLAQEEIQGPVELVDVANESCDQEKRRSEGTEYSREKLRKYQLSRFKYYYAVVECDSRETAEHIYEQCNGLEYEHSGGQIDLRFIPDNMSFDDREARSVSREEMMPVDFTPVDYVSSALQQSKIKLTWDETDPKRMKITQRNFTKDDVQSMNFRAYLASSSESEGEEERTKEDKILHYKALLEDRDKEEGESPTEEMEIVWEPGLRENMEGLVKKKKKESDVQSPWELYLQQKKERRKEAKLKRGMEGTDKKEIANKESVDSGFDDPFFQHSVTTATAGRTKSKKRKKKDELKEADSKDSKEKDELELLMMSDGEGNEEKQHFNFSSILRSEKEMKRRKKKKIVKPVDDFKVDVSDPRFQALYESHLFAPDPSAPQYKASSGMEQIMKERQQRMKKVHHKEPSINQPVTDTSLNSLVKSIQSKTKSFKSQKRKLATK